jgi:hypothetical protein
VDRKNIFDQRAVVSRAFAKGGTKILLISKCALALLMAALVVRSAYGQNGLPDTGVTLAQFKHGFTQHITQIAPKLQMKGKTKLFDANFAYVFAPHINVSLWTDNRSLIKKLEVNGLPSESATFWNIVDATIETVDESQTGEERETVLRKIGKTGSDSVPKAASLTNFHGLEYIYGGISDYDKTCSLTIQKSSHSKSP